MKYANLHMHSLYSDGIYTPEELCALAKQKGYHAVALTDHETVRGIPAMKKAADEAGLGFVTGMEITAKGCGLEKGSFHIVGLGFDPDHPRIKAYTDWTEYNAAQLCRKRFDYCIENGIIGGITWEEVLQRFPDVGWLCNEQVYKLLQEKQGLSDEGYWDYIQHFNGAPVKGTSNTLDAAEAIDVIRAAGGIAVLAHPHRQTQYLPALHALGLAGVEVDHPDLDEYDAAEAIRLANELGMYKSGGTDHTGVLGNNMKRGAGAVLNWIPLIPLNTDVENGVEQSDFEAILARKLG